MRRHFRNHNTALNNRSQGKEDPSASVFVRRRKHRVSHSPPASPQRGVGSHAKSDFLVLRPDVHMYPLPLHETRGSGQRDDVSFSSLTHEAAPTATIMFPEDSDAESSQFEEDELMDDTNPPSHFHRPTPSYRLQTVADFNNSRYSHPRYNQSDIRSLPPPRPLSSSSATSSSAPNSPEFSVLRSRGYSH